MLYFCDETKACVTVDDALLKRVNVLKVTDESSRDLLECRENKEILPRVHRPSVLKRSMNGKEITFQQFQCVAKDAIERKASQGGFVIMNTIRATSTNIVEKDVWNHFCQVWSHSDCTYDCVRSAMCTCCSQNNRARIHYSTQNKSLIYRMKKSLNSHTSCVQNTVMP